ncbi:PBP1A family penicillin-binding protein [Candidatus Gottesmanbacteria bacterium]|nr:PBP1A family penicillin-binding protein [Candidatus Gottesmanbacteria bacterium]
MGKRRLQRDLTLIFIAPLILLKWIGDLLINFVKLFFKLCIKTYNILFSFFSLGKKISNKFWLRREKKAEAIVYKRTLKFYLQSKFSRLKKFLSPKPPSLPSFGTFFIKLKYFLLGAVVVAMIAAIYQLNIIVKSLPNPLFLTNRDIPTTTKIYDRHGKLLYEIYAEENRTPIKLADTPKIVKDATIAIEDREFYKHQGFSAKGIFRALIHNLNSDSLEGGSTITQQLVRSALLTPERTWSRKIKEFFLSIWTERLYNKDQILEMYLNQVPYGGTAWGIEAAAQTYFGKKTQGLTLSEAALLAGLPAAPTFYSPFGAHPELAKIRQEEVLSKMVESGFISAEQKDVAKKQVLSFRRPTVPISAPHFVMYVKDLLEKQYGPRIVERGGLRVTTTLDLQLQEVGQKAVATQIESLRPLNVGNGAALITDPKTGEILAMVGGVDFFDKENGGNVNVATALRQPGSSIKVVTYAAALRYGYTAASILDDSPITYKIIGAPSYTPVNYDGKYHGKIPLRIALASSYNVPAVKVLSTVGVKNMIEQGRLMGITTWDDENRFGLSLTLGGGEVTMLDMAKVYGTLAEGGVRRNLTPILNIVNYRGESLPTPVIQNEIQAVSPAIAFILTNILSDNFARTPAFGPNSALNIAGKTVAVKTGTSDNKRDNWTIGYTPDYVVVVWVGNNDNSPMNPSLTSGITGAAPIWNEIIRNILSDIPDKQLILPEDITSMPCFGRIEFFIKGTEPKGGCILPPTNTPGPSPQ